VSSPSKSRSTSQWSGLAGAVETKKGRSRSSKGRSKCSLLFKLNFTYLRFRNKKSLCRASSSLSKKKRHCPLSKGPPASCRCTGYTGATVGSGQYAKLSVFLNSESTLLRSKAEKAIQNYPNKQACLKLEKRA